MSIVDETVAQDVRRYAAAVRAALADLGPETVDDLTDGLEANLVDALADERRQHRGSLVDEFGTPEAYAAELRAAAGVAPARSTFGDVLRLPDRRVRELGSRLLVRLRGRAWWPPVEEFAVALRPAWWVVRAWVVYQLVAQVLGVAPSWLPRPAVAWVLLLVVLVASVQAGRGQWFTTRPARGVVAVVSVVSVVALLPLAATVRAEEEWTLALARDAARGTTDRPSVYLEVPQDGVVVDGMPVSNLFVYDAAGDPLTDVQVYDDRGRPVRTTFDEGTSPWYRPDSDEPWYFAPTASDDGRVRWNVYPLRGWSEGMLVRDEDTGELGPPSGLAPVAPPFPFAKAPAVAPGPAGGSVESGSGEGDTDPGAAPGSEGVDLTPTAGPLAPSASPVVSTSAP